VLFNDQPSYIDVIYPNGREYETNQYPQMLCNYISSKYFTHCGKLLDVGSGRGSFSVGFSRNGHQISSVDKFDDCVNHLVSICDSHKCDIEHEHLPHQDNSFDWVFSKSVIEHVCNTDNFMKEVFRVLKPQGVAVIMTPAWESQYKFFWDDYTHVKAFTRKSLQNAMIIYGFRDVRVDYFYQLPFVWGHKSLLFVPKLVSLLPDRLKWKDHERRDFRTLIRFSKEKMLLGVGCKYV